MGIGLLQGGQDGFGVARNIFGLATQPDVIDADEQDHRCGFQGEHIGVQAIENTARRVAADAAIDRLHVRENPRE